MVLAGIWACLGAIEVVAQQVRPSDEKRPMPDVSVDPADSGRSQVVVEPLPPLPNLDPMPERLGIPLPPPPLGEKGADADRMESIFVRRIEIAGNSLIATPILRTVTAPREGSRLSIEEIRSVREELTRVYVDHGWITSRAVVPPQDLSGGILRFEIVEGFLESIEILNDGLLRDGFVRARLASLVNRPFGSPRFARPSRGCSDVRTSIRSRRPSCRARRMA
ncbi:MAG: ShlB/FhaC/HecB family hemolysin secretion/activation protein [Deltaproteobacteria bacterium]|nr:ShlB/FhaC/HecB family hemolysin secretion/activation protein [Deltaproteobacteria bacterium]